MHSSEFPLLRTKDPWLGGLAISSVPLECTFTRNQNRSETWERKVFHSEGHPERFTELYGEEKREERDRGDQEEKRGNQKRRAQASQ